MNDHVQVYFKPSRYLSISFMSVNAGENLYSLPSSISRRASSSIFRVFAFGTSGSPNSMRWSLANCLSWRFTTIESGTPIFLATFRALSRTSLSTLNLITVFITEVYTTVVFCQASQVARHPKDQVVFLGQQRNDLTPRFLLRNKKRAGMRWMTPSARRLTVAIAKLGSKTFSKSASVPKIKMLVNIY